MNVANKLNSLIPMSGMLGVGLAAACAVGLTAFAQSAQATLIHEYSFNSGTVNPSSGAYTTPDSIGGASYAATLMGSGSISNGQLVLTNNNVTSGAAGLAYLSMPVSVLPTTSPTVSFEEWFTGSYDYKTGTSGGVYAQNRGFDFNNDTLNTSAAVPTDAETVSPNGTSGQYLFQSLDTGNGSGVGITAAGYGSGSSFDTGYQAGNYSKDWLTQPSPTGAPVTHMITVVIDQTATASAPFGTLTYYVDGTNYSQSVNLTAANQWTAVSPSFTNAWLGRSAFAPDGVFNGTIDEFRIFNNALSSSQVAADFAAGPNTVLTPEPASLALFGLAGASLLLVRRRRATA